MFKKVKNVNDLAIQKRFIDTKKRCVVECLNAWQLGNMFELAEVDNHDNVYCYTIAECRQNLLIYNMTDSELRAVLCMTMFELIEFMIYEMKQKGEN